ncbi:Type I restriction-modification system methyltransferase subunit [[Clostridium] sordellii]|nr:Type I restriction-modification system methyltransferase subunit [[Clostridium] sordellii] [Paeniclostridium sordellii]
MMDFNKIFGVDDSYKAPDKIMKVLYDKEKREELFMKLLEEHNYDVGFDWFHKYFEDEHADRKTKKQDFTPECVADLLSKLAMGSENDGNYYECCCGTGGLLIKHWDNFRRTYSPFDYKPQYHFAVVEELSDRTIPFLLLNMMIRGMNGIVIHGDVLTRQCKNAYFICNTKNDHLQFSGITNIPHTEQFERELKVNFINDDYFEHKELMDFDILRNL